MPPCKVCYSYLGVSKRWTCGLKWLQAFYLVLLLLYSWIDICIPSCHIWAMICFICWKKLELEGHENTLTLTPSLPLGHVIHLVFLRSAQCSFCPNSLNEFVVLAFRKLSEYHKHLPQQSSAEELEWQS